MDAYGLIFRIDPPLTNGQVRRRKQFRRVLKYSITFAILPFLPRCVQMEWGHCYVEYKLFSRVVGLTLPYSHRINLHIGRSDTRHAQSEMMHILQIFWIISELLGFLNILEALSGRTGCARTPKFDLYFVNHQQSMNIWGSFRGQDMFEFNISNQMMRFL